MVREPRRPRLARLLACGAAAWLALFLLSMRTGASGAMDAQIVAQLRLPRALMATAVGIGLAVAGAVLQALFTNPLCEPYTLGVSSGAALGAVAGAWLGMPLVISGLTGSAFLGALVFAFALHAISATAAKTRFGLLLSGVMLGLFGSSLVAVCVALSDPNGLSGALFWLLGDLSRARPQGAAASLVLVSILAAAVWTQWRDLDALLVGEESALALGVDVESVRRRLLFLCSLLIGVCVSCGGMIGFVGLVVPHFARLRVGSLHRVLIPACAVGGAVSLLGADTLVRAVARPYELPVGVVTSLVGAPIFLWILLRQESPDGEQPR